MSEGKLNGDFLEGLGHFPYEMSTPLIVNIICVIHTHTLIFDENGITTMTSVRISDETVGTQRLLSKNLVEVLGRVVSAVYYNIII